MRSVDQGSSKVGPSQALIGLARLSAEFEAQGKSRNPGMYEGMKLFASAEVLQISRL
jgi:hypothetical protein